MANRSIDKVTDMHNDVKRNLETKKSELEDLEKRKKELLDAGIAVQGSDMDEKVIQTIMGEINRSLEENSEKGEELSTEMTDDVKNLDDMKTDVQEMSKSAEDQKKKLEGKKSILDKFGLGKGIENAISEIDSNQVDLENLQNGLLESEHELNQISQKLNSL